MHRPQETEFEQILKCTDGNWGKIFRNVGSILGEIIQASVLVNFIGVCPFRDEQVDLIVCHEDVYTCERSITEQRGIFF